MLYDEELQPEEIGLTKRRGKLLQISSWLNLENKVSIGCAGAVIQCLHRRSAVHLHDDPDDNLAFRVAHLEMFTLRGTM